MCLHVIILLTLPGVNDIIKMVRNTYLRRSDVSFNHVIQKSLCFKHHLPLCLEINKCSRKHNFYHKVRASKLCGISYIRKLISEEETKLSRWKGVKCIFIYGESKGGKWKHSGKNVKVPLAKEKFTSRLLFINSTSTCDGCSTLSCQVSKT